MSIYRIHPDNIHEYITGGRTRLRRRLRGEYTLIIAILCVALFMAIRHSLGPREEFHVATYVIGLSAISAIIVFSLQDRWRRGVQHLAETVATYQLTVEPGKILCVTSRTRPIVLEPKEVVKVQEDSRHGLHLCTSDPKLCIVVPPQLENFEACKAELRSQGLRWESEA